MDKLKQKQNKESPPSTQGGWGHRYLFEKDHWNFFRFAALPIEITDNKMKPHSLPLEILQNCVRPIGISKIKNQDPWKFHSIFSWSSLEIWLQFPHFLNILGSSMPITTLLGFFWNNKSPIIEKKWPLYSAYFAYLYYLPDDQMPK